MKGLAYIDRGAVLFVGMAVGAVLTLAFQHDGHVLEPLLAPVMAAETAPAAGNAVESVAAPVAQAPAPTPGKVACGRDFPLSARVTAALAEGRPLRIGVLGDSFGDGIWQATNQHFLGRKGFAVYRFSKEGTGFTRYRSLDLLADVKARMADQPIDIAIVDFGANDTQGVWDNGHGAAFMSQRWQRVIGGRVEALVAHLRDQGVAVGWIGLPRMRKPDYDQQVQAMNGFYASLMCRLNVPFTDAVRNSEDKDHHFAKELIDPVTHASYTARAEDGVHMSFHGYRVIARPLLQRIDDLAARGGAPKPAGAAKDRASGEGKRADTAARAEKRAAAAARSASHADDVGSADKHTADPAPIVTPPILPAATPSSGGQ